MLRITAVAFGQADSDLHHRFTHILVCFVWFAVTLWPSSTLAQSSAPSATKVATVNIDGREMRAIGFDLLSAFKYTIVDLGNGATPDEIKAAKARDQVPAWIRAFDGQRVALTGYMMPLTLDDGLSKKFIMMKDLNTCCYGAVPSMNDYVIVTMKDQGVSPVQDIPVRLVGTFRIDQRYEGDYLVSLFVMDGEKFHGPLK